MGEAREGGFAKVGRGLIVKRSDRAYSSDLVEPIKAPGSAAEGRSPLDEGIST